MRSLDALARVSPAVADLRTYDRSWLRGDVVAGLTVAAYLIPQVMAYSVLAGLSPQTGLWLAIISLTAYFIVGKSRSLSVGPESTTALLTAATLAPFALGDPARYAMLAATLAALVGIVSLIAWGARLGFIGDFISRPVLVGYMAGVGVIMIASQLGKVTGVDTAGDTFINVVRGFIRGLAEDGINMPTLALGLVVAAALIALTPRFPRLPMPLIVVGAAAAIAALLNLESLGVEMVGTIDIAPPHLSFDIPSGSDVAMLALPAVGIFVVGFTDNILTARMFATKRHERIDGNRELFALGAINIASAGAHGMPVSSSASRAALGDAAGARTQLYSLVAAGGTLVVMLLFGGVLGTFPNAALGGLVIFAATRLIDLREFRRLWSFRRREFLLAAFALVGVLAFDILYGVLAAIALSIIELLVRVTRPHAAVLGQPPDTPGWHDIDDYPDARRIDGLVVVRYDSPLFFANAEDFADHCEEALDASPTPPRWLLINMESNTTVDITALDALERVRVLCTERGVVLALVRVKQNVIAMLNKHGVGGRIGAERIYPTLPTAVSAYEQWAEPDQG